MSPLEPEETHIDLRDNIPVGTFILRLELSRTNRLVGSISRLSETSAIEFDGWIDFMTVIQELRLEVAPEQPASPQL